MTSRSRFLLIMAAFAVAAGTARAELATPQSGSVTVAATAFNDGPATTNVDSDTWTGAPTSLSAVTSLTLTSVHGTVQVGGSAAADWASADAGQVRFSDFGWTRSGSGGWALTSLCGTGCGMDPPAWSYSFVATANGGFHMNYDILARSDDQYGLLGWQFFVNGQGDNYGAFFDSDAAPLDGQHVTGTLGAPLVAGRAYTIILAPNAYSLSQLFDRSAYMSGVFDWTITTEGVPEPSTWALLLTGFFGAGAVVRRARRIAARA